MTTELAYWEARTRALERELERDERIVLLGGFLNVPFNPDGGFVERYADRILWPPISENATCGLAVGAAIAGLRPFVPLGTSSFMFYAWPQIANEAPNVRYLSHGASRAPVVFHVMAGARRSSGAQHEHTPQAMLQNIPGLYVFAPATPADVDGLLHAAFALEDPVVIADHVLLGEATGPVPDRPDAAIGRACLRRQGRDVLLVASGIMVHRALDAAATLAVAGVDASVLDLRTIVPLPVEDVLAAAADHDAVVAVDESRLAGSTAALVAALVAQQLPGLRVRTVCSAAAPSPFAVELLDEVVPTTSRIVDETTALLDGA